MSKTRLIVAGLLALFYVLGSMVLGGLIGWCCLWIFYMTQIAFFYWGYFVFPCLGFLFGVFYAFSVLRNDRT